MNPSVLHYDCTGGVEATATARCHPHKGLRSRASDPPTLKVRSAQPQV